MASPDGYLKFDTKIDTSGFQKGVGSLGSIAKKGLSAATAAIGTVAVGLTAAGGAAVKFGSDFEQSAAKASTLFGDVDVDTKKLNKDILDLSSTTGTAATELNEALYSALSSGIPVTEDMSEALEFLESSTKLAKAGFTDIDTTLTATAKTLNAYGLSVSETNRIQGILMQTQNLGITTVGELGAYLAQVTPTAAALGVSFENVGAALAVMTAQGTPTAQATTQLNSLIAELGKSGTTAADNLTKAAEGTQYAGMSFSQMMESGASLGTVLQMIQAEADANNLSMIDMFSSIEAGRAALSIASEEGEKFNDSLAAMSDTSGLVEDAYNKVTNTLQGQAAIIKEELKNLGIAIYTEQSGWLANMAAFGSDMISRLTEAFDEGGMDALVGELGSVFADVATSVSDYAPNMIEAAGNLISSFLDGIHDNVSQIANGAVNIVSSLAESIITNLPILISTAGELVLSFAEGIVDELPELIDTAADMISNIADGIADNVDKIVNTGVDLITALVDGLVQALPKLAASAPRIILNLAVAIIANIPQILAAGVQLIGGLWNGIVSGFGSLLSGLWDLLNTYIFQPIGNAAVTIVDYGVNLVKGLWQGISSAAEWLIGKIKEWCGNILDAVKGFFGIASPSKVFRDDVGVFIPLGVAEGIDKTAPQAIAAVQDMADGMLTACEGYGEEAKKIYARQEKQRQKEAEDEYNERLANAEDAAEAEEIKQERILQIQEEADKRYLDGVKAKNEEEDLLREDAYNRLDRMRDLNLITEAEYYSELERMRDEYFIEGSSAWLEHTQEIYAYNTGVLEDLKESVKDTWEEIAQQAADYSEEVESSITGMADKLKNYGNGLFETSTITFKGEGRGYILNENGAYQNEEDRVVTRTTLADLKGDIAALEAYQNALLGVKERGEELFGEEGIPDGFFEMIRDLSVEDGTAFAGALLEATDKEFTAFLNDWAQKQEKAEGIAEILYGDEKQQAQEAESFWGNVGENLERELTGLGIEVPDGFFDIGEDSAVSFEEGFLGMIDTAILNIKREISNKLSGLTPQFAYEAYGGDSAGGNVYNYYLQPTGESVQEQLDEIDDYNTRERLRKGIQ